LDAAVMRAIQRIDTFGPLPAGDHMPIEFQFNYHTN
jgi:protein TonB